MKKILTIDYDLDNLNTIKEILKNKFPEYDILTTHSATEGIELAKTEKPNLIITEITFSNTDDFEVLQLLKADEHIKSIPVVILTAIKNNSENRVKSLEMGAEAFLSKPINERELVAQLNAIFSAKNSELNAIKKSNELEKLVGEKLDEIKYQALMLSNITESVISFDDNYIIKSWNKGAEKMYGWSENEVIGKKFQKVLNPIFFENYQSCEIIASQTGVINLEALHTTKDKGTIYVSKTKSPIFDTHNNAVGNICIARDITKQKKAELEIKKLSEAVEQSPTSVIITNLKGEIEYVNQTFQNTTGYALAEITGRNPRFLSTKNTTPEEYKVLWDTISSGGTWRGEFYNRKKNGEFYWEDALIKPILNTEGEITNYIAVKLDITEKKRVETIQKVILNISNSVNSTNEINDFFKVIQKELGKIIETKNFFLALYNEENDSLYLPFYQDENEYPVEFPLKGSLTSEVIKSGKTLLLNYDEAYEIIKKNNIIIKGKYPKSWLGVPLKIKEKVTGAIVIQSYNEEFGYTEKDKEVLAFISHQISISIELKKRETQLIKAKEKAEEGAEKYKNLVEKGKIAIVVDDNSGNLIYFNNQFLNLFGYSAEELKEKTHKNFVHPDDVKYVAEHHKKRMLGEISNSRYEFKGIKKDGTTIFIEIDVVEIIIDEGNITGSLSYMWDITERKFASIEIEKAKEKAEESDRLKSAFLANMSHEIRTPMNAILGFSDLLMDQNITSVKQDKYHEIINASGKRLMNLINDIIDVSKIDAKELKLKGEVFNLNKLIDQLQQQFIISPKNKKTTISTVKAFMDADSFIFCDETRLAQVISNLLENALKFTHNGIIEFGYLFEENRLHFFVKDSGVGINAKDHQRIFERFGQSDNEILKVKEGSGLGLAICKGIVELMGGNIWVESELNKGATFHFIKPYCAVNAKSNKQEEIKEFVIENNEIKTILIAEDEETNYWYIEAALDKQPFNLIHVANGKEAVEAIQTKNNIDLILMDFNMPIMNGMDATKEIRKTHPTIPIIALTAYAMMADKEKALSIGCTDYLSKPISKNVLLETINKYLKAKVFL
jgi:PAS domain S-box-containing protein